jgi:hypothetical protein
MSRQLSSWRDGLTARLGKKVPHDSTSLVNEKTREPQGGGEGSRWLILITLPFPKIKLHTKDSPLSSSGMAKQGDCRLYLGPKTNAQAVAHERQSRFHHEYEYFVRHFASPSFKALR